MTEMAMAVGIIITTIEIAIIATMVDMETMADMGIMVDMEITEDTETIREIVVVLSRNFNR